MKAILITRCGCRRELLTTFPAPPNIIVPLSEEGWKENRLRPGFWPTNCEYRRFQLESSFNDGLFDDDGFATYSEVK